MLTGKDCLAEDAGFEDVLCMGILWRAPLRRKGGEVRGEMKSDSKGMTLIELIVTFAVAAIFMAAAALLIVPATKMTMHIKGMNRVHDEAAIIMETIRNELSYADAYTENTGTEVPTIGLKYAYPTDAGDDAYDADYAGYYKSAAYSDKGGNPAEIKVDDQEGSESQGRLQIVYAEISDNPDGAAESEVIREEIKWWYGKGLYQNNQLRLGFKKKDPDKNIITVKLTIIDPTSGYSYTEEADIRCMNVNPDRIKEIV